MNATPPPASCQATCFLDSWARVLCQPRGQASGPGPSQSGQPGFEALLCRFLAASLQFVSKMWRAVPAAPKPPPVRFQRHRGLDWGWPLGPTGSPLLVPRCQ